MFIFYSLDSWALKKDLESKGINSDSVIDALVNATKDKPWLWALYVLVVLVPIVLMFVFCCGGDKKGAANAKKTDAPTEDDQQPEAEEAEENKADGVDEDKPSKSDLEDSEEPEILEAPEEEEPVEVNFIRD